MKKVMFKLIKLLAVGGNDAINLYQQTRIACLNRFQMTLEQANNGYRVFDTRSYAPKVGSYEAIAASKVYGAKMMTVPSHHLFAAYRNALIGNATIEAFQAECRQAFELARQFFMIVGQLKKADKVLAQNTPTEYCNDRLNAESNFKQKQLFQRQVFTYGSGNDQSFNSPKANVGVGKYEGAFIEVRKALPAEMLPRSTGGIGADMNL